MKINRRDAMKTIGATAISTALPSLALGEEKKVSVHTMKEEEGHFDLPSSIELITMLGDPSKGCEIQKGKIDLNGTPDEVHDSIQKLLWWPDGNSQGVFHKVIFPVCGNPKDGVVEGEISFASKEIVPPKELCEFQCSLTLGGHPPLFDLYLNRFWMEIFSHKKNNIYIGGSVAYPTGYYGYKHIGLEDGVSKNSYFGDMMIPRGHDHRFSDLGMGGFMFHPPVPEIDGFKIASTLYEQG